MPTKYKKPPKYRVSLRQKLKRDQWKASRLGINPNDEASKWLEANAKPIRTKKAKGSLFLSRAKRLLANPFE